VILNPLSYTGGHQYRQQELYWFENLRLIDRTRSTTKAYADLQYASGQYRLVLSNLELLSNLVFGRLSSSFPRWLVSSLHPVYKSDPGDDLGQETESSHPAPVLLCALR